MTAFLIGAATLVALAVLVLLWPLLRGARVAAAPAALPATRVQLNAGLYRDQLAELERDRAAGSLAAADFDDARRELQRRLLEDAAAAAAPDGAPARGPARRSALALALGVPLAAALLYAQLGTPQALQPEPTPAEARHQVEQMIARLAERLERNPDDASGWLMLARSYRSVGRAPDAVRAFERAGAVVDTRADFLADYADVLAQAAGGTLHGRPAELLERALALDPDHPQALLLAGAAAAERGDRAGALAHWRRLLQQLPPDSDDAKLVAQGIATAVAAGVAASAPAATLTGAPPAPAGPASR